METKRSCVQALHSFVGQVSLSIFTQLWMDTWCVFCGSAQHLLAPTRAHVFNGSPPPIMCETSIGIFWWFMKIPEQQSGKLRKNTYGVIERRES